MARKRRRCHRALLWKGKDENRASVLLVRNEKGTPDHIAIKDGDSLTSLISMPGDTSGAMVAISADDYDYDMMNSMYRFGDYVQVSVEGRGTCNNNPDGMRRAHHALYAYRSKTRTRCYQARETSSTASTAHECCCGVRYIFLQSSGGTPEGA